MKHFSGTSLMEVSICIILLGILSVGVGNMLQDGVKMQVIASSEATQENIAMRLTNQLREDLRGGTITFQNNNHLMIQKLGQTIDYHLIGNQMRRKIGGTSIEFPSDGEKNQQGLQLNCIPGNQCFRITNYSSATFSTPMLMLGTIQIIDTKSNSSTTSTPKWKAFSFGPIAYRMMTNSTFN